jgi:AAA15 family ATPase/GTPase
MSQSTSTASNGNGLVQGITGISVRGFKSLYEECNIEIRPLTILAGANSSGKSSIMQPLLLMKQTLEATYDPGALLIYGSNVRFTLVDQLLSMLSDEKCTDRFTIKVETDSNLDNSHFINTFKKHPEKGIEIIETTLTLSKGTEIKVSFQVNELKDIVWVNPDKLEEEKPIEWLEKGAEAESDRLLGTFGDR